MEILTETNTTRAPASPKLALAGVRAVPPPPSPDRYYPTSALPSPRPASSPYHPARPHPSHPRPRVERSSLPSMCDPGDEIMTDKGFNVEDMFIPYHVAINIPTFFKKKNRMSNETVIKDRKIASKRVHIERIIGLAKTYKILRDPIW